MDERPPSAAQISRELGTTPATLRRWVARGLISQFATEFELIGDVRLKDFSVPTELFLARSREG